MSEPFALALPPEAIEAIAQRAAAIVLAELAEAVRDHGMITNGTDEPAGDWLSPDEAAALLRCGRQRIYEMRADRRLTPFREGGRAVVSRQEVEALVKCI